MKPQRFLPSLNALKAFEAAGRALNFRIAAEELCVSQGAVAQQVRALEQHLGIALFHRQPHGLAFTAKGAVYFADISRAFDLLYEATEKLQTQPGMVTISVTPTVATKLLIPSLGNLHSSLPNVELCTVATEALSDFDRDRVDIAVRLCHSAPDSTMNSLLLFHQDLVAVTSPSLITGLTLPLTVEQLRKMPLLHDSHNHWPKFLQCATSLPGPVFNQTALALDAAMAGQGVTLACKAFAEADLKSGRLVVVANAGIVPGSYFLLCKNGSTIRKEVSAVREWCKKALTYR